MNDIVRPILATILAVVLGTATDGCKAVKSPEVDASYSAETVACAATAKTFEESRECRKKVNHKWGLCPSQDYDIPC